MNHYYDITLTEHHTMNLPGQPCETREDYVFQTCVRRKLSDRFTFMSTMIRQSRLQRWHKSMTTVSFFSDQSTSSWTSQNTSPNVPNLQPRHLYRSLDDLALSLQICFFALNLLVAQVGLQTTLGPGQQAGQLLWHAGVQVSHQVFMQGLKLFPASTSCSTKRSTKKS